MNTSLLKPLNSRLILLSARELNKMRRVGHKEMLGHGIGRQFHCQSEIPHYGKRGTGLKLRSGMVFTVEPILSEGTGEIKFLADGWTVKTKDKKLSAQFEHTVAVTDTGVEILTL